MYLLKKQVNFLQCNWVYLDFEFLAKRFLCLCNTADSNVRHADTIVDILLAKTGSITLQTGNIIHHLIKLIAGWVFGGAKTASIPLQLTPQRILS